VTDGVIDTLAIAGSPDECRARLAAYREAGLTLPLLVTGDDDEQAGLHDIITLLG
jgi:hypothetical protein